jgi:DnaJ-class molecular chaperone
MALMIDEDDRPTCPCCMGTGMHGHRASVSPSPDDDSEGCTNCGERGRTFFTDAKPWSCTGYRTLMRRVNR